MRHHKYTNSFETKTGLSIHVRPLTRSDAPYLVDLFENMGSESRYNRFLESVDRVDVERVWQEAEHIARGVDDNAYGFIAFADLPDRESAPVAVARYVRLSTAQAEIAISVRDDMQNIGIGTALLSLLIRHAAVNGIDRLTGTMQNSNASIWAILKKMNYRLERQPEGSYSLITLHVNEMGSRFEDWLDAASDYSPEPQLVW